MIISSTLLQYISNDAVITPGALAVLKSSSVCYYERAQGIFNHIELCGTALSIAKMTNAVINGLSHNTKTGQYKLLFNNLLVGRNMRGKEKSSMHLQQLHSHFYPNLMPKASPNMQTQSSEMGIDYCSKQQYLYSRLCVSWYH